MPERRDVVIGRLDGSDVAGLRALNAMFGQVFDEPGTYGAAPPGDAYLARLLASETFIAVAARSGETTVGGLVAYELMKFESERSEIYIYDLGVAEAFRRRGVATALIEYLKEIAAARGAYVIFVQADYVDPPAVALYTKLGAREDVMHFDIEV